MDLLTFWLVAIICAIGSISANPLFSSDEPNEKIVGGFVTTIEKNPWQVALLSDNLQVCGGSIIDEKWVLSAAHCRGNFIRAGSSYRAKDGQIARVKSYIQHENYTSIRNDYDFALLELSQPLQFTDKIKSIALPDADAKIEDGTLCLVSGWGQTQNYSESNSQLRAVHIPIANHEYCKERYSNMTYKVTDRMICAGYEDGTKSPCYGDSGGPLSEYETGAPRLIGVVSWGMKCGAPYYPGVFSRVTSVRQWIKSITGI